MQRFFGSATNYFCSKICSRRGEKMKFCEKLLKLRKQNNMSQEQLADKLGVSRQAVSKWESGTSIPDMEKMMQLCKILNCNLEDLVDDGVGSSKKIWPEEKITWNIYYKEVIDFITKTLNMFWSMRLVEKIKCLLEMIFLFLILWLVWSVIGNIIYSAFLSILLLLPTNIHNFIYSVCSFIYQIFGVVAGFVLIVHIFKIRYLDYFITIEDQESKEKSIEVPVEELEQPEKEEARRFIEHKKNKIIIRDPKHSTYNFFGTLAKLVVWCLKFLFLLFAIPCMISFIGITFLDICCLWYIKDGVFFLGLFLAIFGGLMINYLVLKMIYYFIFELKYPFPKIFICFIIGLILIGTGGGISFCNYLTFEKINLDEQEKITTTKTIEYQENLVLQFLGHENVEVKEDNNLSNIKIEIQHIKETIAEFQSNTDYTNMVENNQTIESTYFIYYLDVYNTLNGFDEMNYFLNTIRNKKRVDTSTANYSYQVTIYASKDIIQKLQDNYQKYYR